MPYAQESPLGSAAAAVASFFNGREQSRQQKLAEDEQKKHDDISAQMLAAQMANYRAEAGRDAAQEELDRSHEELDASNVTKNKAALRAQNLGPDGKPLGIFIPKSIQEMHPGNKGKITPITLEDKYQHTMALFLTVQKNGVEDKFNPYYQPLVQLHQQVMAAQREQAAAAADHVKFHQQVTLKQIPTYANLHPRERVGRKPVAGADADTIDLAESEISKSPNPSATAAHLAAIAIAHGGSPKTVQAIRETGTYWADKKNIAPRTQQGGGLPQAPP